LKIPVGRIVEWIQANDVALAWTATASMFVFVATLIAIPWLVTKIPHDYFIRKKRFRVPWSNQHPALRALLVVGKNLLGAVFVVVGMAMLVMPGQGIMTILVGMVLLDFPGKYRLERWVVTRRSVLRTLNWFRRRAGRPPLVVNEPDESKTSP